MMPMGEVDGGTSVKRRTGRPPKLHSVVVEVESNALVDPGAGAETILFVGGRGSYLRSTPEWLDLEKAGMLSALVGNSSGGDRGRGRPPKMREMGWLWDRGQASSPGSELFRS